jgi:hypothetical protein
MKLAARYFHANKYALFLYSLLTFLISFKILATILFRSRNGLNFPFGPRQISLDFVRSDHRLWVDVIRDLLVSEAHRPTQLRHQYRGVPVLR